MPDQKNYPDVIHLSEATSTWGCHYTIPGNDKIHYGFSDLPPKSSLWLECASGDAVEQVIMANLGQVISTQRGGYGGEKRTVSVNVSSLEEMCRKYWDRQNAAHERQVERSQYCHYCGGSPVVSIDFFDESVCTQCSN